MGYKTTIYAIFRMLVQLLLIGYVLTYIFETNSNYIVITILIIMLLTASWISLRTTSLPRKTLLLNAVYSIVLGGVTVLQAYQQLYFYILQKIRLLKLKIVSNNFNSGYIKLSLDSFSQKHLLYLQTSLL